MTRHEAYYNDNEPYVCQWLRNLIAAGLIAPGDVDERSIKDVKPDDLRGYTQAHWFAGLGGWPLALRLAGWPDTRECWTGSSPCQPHSVAGRRKGFADDRDLWPAWLPLIETRRPDTIFGEQVTGSPQWITRVYGDLETLDYAVGCLPVEASCAGAPHLRERYWFVAQDLGIANSAGPFARRETSEAARYGDTAFTGNRASALADASCSERRARPQGRCNVNYWPDARREEAAGRFELGRQDTVGDTSEPRLAVRPLAEIKRRDIRDERTPTAASGHRSAWDDAEWLIGADGKTRRVKSGVRLLDHGIPARVAKLRAFGNAIVPQVAAEFIGAFMELRP